MHYVCEYVYESDDTNGITLFKLDLKLLADLRYKQCNLSSIINYTKLICFQDQIIKSYVFL